MFFKLTNTYKRFGVSSITEFEVYVGSNTKQDVFWNEFFSFIEVIPYDSLVNKEAIRINRSLKSKRKQIDIPDLMIGTTAKLLETQLATLNVKHFQLIDGLELISS